MNRSAYLACAALLLFAGSAAAQEFDLNRVDANNDGAITRSEAEAARAAMFNRADLNHDGLISASEREAVAERIAQRGQRRVLRADANGDGAISRDEFMRRPFRGFDHFDANHDGVLSANETAALRARLEQR